MSSSQTTLRLTPRQAMARLSVVSLIQILGIIVTFTLLLTSHLFVSENWQKFCWWVGGIAAGVSFLSIVLTYAIMGIKGRTNVDWTERIIRIIFAINTIALALGIARTGGASNSVFSQTIPIQLSGILLLELQKEKFTSSHSRASWWYTVFSVLIWVGVELAQKSSTWQHGFASDMSVVALQSWHRIAVTVLGVAGILFTLVAYKLPNSRFFLEFFKGNE